MKRPAENAGLFYLQLSLVRDFLSSIICFGGIKIYPYNCGVTIILLTKPTILFLFCLRFFFYSDEHLPMHVHVKNGDGKAKINIETA